MNKIMKICVAVLLSTHIFGVRGDCEIKTPNRCDTSKPEVVNFIKGNTSCPDEVVTLQVGETYEVHIDFTPVKDAEKALSVVMVHVMSLDIPIHITDANACTNHGLECPLKTGQTYDYRPVFEVKPRLPISSELQAVLSWSLVDEKLEPIFCVKFDILVKPKLKYSDTDDYLLTFQVVP